MQQVQVHLFAGARATSTDVIEVSPGTLTSVLEQCIAKYPSLSQAIPQCAYLVNGLTCGDMEQEISAGSRVDVLPRFAGGA